MSAKPSPTGSGSVTRDSLREGDHGAGIPRSPLKGVRVLSKKKKDRLIDKRNEDLQQRDKDLERKFEERSRQRDTAKSWSSLLGLVPLLDGIRQLKASICRVAAWIRWVAVSVVGLLLIRLVAALFDVIKTLPAPFNWIVGVSAICFAAVIFVWLILRIRSLDDMN